MGVELGFDMVQPFNWAISINFSTMGIEIHDLRSHHGLGTTISRKRCHPRVGRCSTSLDLGCRFAGESVKMFPRT